MGLAETLEEESMSISGRCASSSSQGRHVLGLRSGVPGERALLSDREFLSAFSDSWKMFFLNLSTSFLFIPSYSWDRGFLKTKLVQGADKTGCVLGKSSDFILLPVSHECDSCTSVPKSPAGSGCTNDTELLDLWSGRPDHGKPLGTAPHEPGEPTGVLGCGIPQPRNCAPQGHE